eukprot:538642_1
MGHIIVIRHSYIRGPFSENIGTVLSNIKLYQVCVCSIVVHVFRLLWLQLYIMFPHKHDRKMYCNEQVISYRRKTYGYMSYWLWDKMERAIGKRYWRVIVKIKVAHKIYIWYKIINRKG